MKNKNLVQIQMLWRRAQRLMASELSSEIRARYPFEEAQLAVKDYVGQMTGGKDFAWP